MNITAKFSQFTLNTNKEYSPELNDCINSHNEAIAEFAKSLTLSSTISLLIKKEIITEEEIYSEMDFILESCEEQMKLLQENCNHLRQFIECELEYNNNLKEMHEELANNIEPSVENSDSN